MIPDDLVHLAADAICLHEEMEACAPCVKAGRRAVETVLLALPDQKDMRAHLALDLVDVLRRHRPPSEVAGAAVVALARMARPW